NDSNQNTKYLDSSSSNISNSTMNVLHIESQPLDPKGYGIGINNVSVESAQSKKIDVETVADFRCAVEE
ncbi:28278_t:CDS:2, partial [Gigaspora margarita]